MNDDQQMLARMQGVGEAVAQAAGRLALSHLRDSKLLEIESKGPQDFVTAVDKAVERLIRQRLGVSTAE